MLINHEHKSNNHRERKGEKVQFLVLHYTAVPLGTTLGIFTNNYELSKPDAAYFEGSGTDPIALCKQEVSAHYVNSEAGDIFQLVDEERAAYHAGVSYWNGVKNINNSSIGIEQVNTGFKWLKDFPEERGVTVPGSDKLWCEYTEVQLAATIELCKSIILRHDIKAYNVIGHSDIACGRKSDPGPLFPWKRLADAGIGIWFDVNESEFKDSMPDNHITWVQNKLLEFGYDCAVTGEFDEKTKNVMQSFQMHFRQDDVSGAIDLTCVKILDSLCKRKLKLQQQEQNAVQLISASQPRQVMPSDVLVAQTPSRSFLPAFSARNAAMATAAIFGMVAVGVALAAKLRPLG